MCVQSVARYDESSGLGRIARQLCQPLLTTPHVRQVVDGAKNHSASICLMGTFPRCDSRWRSVPFLIEISDRSCIIDCSEVRGGTYTSGIASRQRWQIRLNTFPACNQRFDPRNGMLHRRIIKSKRRTCGIFVKLDKQVSDRRVSRTVLRGKRFGNSISSLSFTPEWYFPLAICSSRFSQVIHTLRCTIAWRTVDSREMTLTRR